MIFELGFFEQIVFLFEILLRPKKKNHMCMRNLSVIFLTINFLTQPMLKDLFLTIFVLIVTVQSCHKVNRTKDRRNSN